MLANRELPQNQLSVVSCQFEKQKQPVIYMDDKDEATARGRPDVCGHWQHWQPAAGYWELGSVRLFTSAKLSGVNSVVESRFPELKRLRGV